MLSRNNQSRFSQNPQLELKRSSFYRETGVKTTFNAGDLIPLYVDEILPGDTVSMDMGSVLRMTTPIHPIMDNANFETFWFFVPYRLLWENFEHFITGGLDAGEWDAPTVYEHPAVRPKLAAPSGDSEFMGYPHKSLADYMGIPVGMVTNELGTPLGWLDPVDGVNALPFRAYAKIWNDWFRSSSIQSEILIPITDGLTTPVVGSFSDDGDMIVSSDPSTCVYGGALLKANKYHDYFTSALLEPQRGQPVGIPLEGAIPVTTKRTGEDWTIPVNANPLMFFKQDSFGVNSSFGGYACDYGEMSGDTVGIGLHEKTQGEGSSLTFPTLYPSNLIAYADEHNTLQVSINDLRHAIAVQHILEIDARSGSGRYIDLLKGHFGVTSPDARFQRAEYLGGESIPINVDQVLQTSATNEVSPQGNAAAFSLTASSGGVFTKSFTEHGILMCLGVVRHVHTYQQGLAKMWSRKDRYDYYWPSLANISEQAVLNKEIFLSGLSSVDNEVFGYQEAWAEYRYKPSLVTGAMRSNYPQSLDVWHFADDYSDTPHLSSEWLQEGSEEIDRTLAVSSAVEDQFIGDFAFKPQYYRVMPVYSVPGLERL